MAALGTFAVAGSAYAQDGGIERAYVADFVGYKGQVRDLVVEQVTRTTRERLDSDPKIDVARPIDATSAATGVRSPAIVEATRLYENARSQYVDQRYTEAAGNFARALELLDANVADIDDWDVVRGLLFRLSVSQFLAGQTDAADATMRRLFAFDPEFALSADDATVTPELIAAFDQLKGDLAARATGSLDTSAVEPGAELWIDGQIRGASPMTIDTLAAGKHYVVLRKGETSHGALVTIEPGVTNTYQASLEAAASASPLTAMHDAVADGVLGDDVSRAAGALANRAATDWIVTVLIVPLEGDAGYAALPLVFNEELATLRQLEPVVFDRDLLKLNVRGYELARNITEAVYDPSLGEVVEADVTVTAASMAAAANVNTTSTSTATTPTPGDTGTGTGTVTDTGTGTEPAIITGIPTDDESWYENPWLWTGVGVGLAVIGGTVAAVVLLSDDGPQEQVTGFNATIEW